MYRVIETDRLTIRPIKLDDKVFILDLLNTKGWLQFIGDRKVKDEKDAEIYIKKIIDNNKFFYSVFEIKETKQPIGIITFLHRDKLKFPDIGFAMLPKFDKKGYAFEACDKYINLVKKEKTIAKILAITLPDNRNSVRLIEKLGLTYEDNFIDDSEVLHLYSIILDNKR